MKEPLTKVESVTFGKNIGHIFLNNHYKTTINHIITILKAPCCEDQVFNALRQMLCDKCFHAMWC